MSSAVQRSSRRVLRARGTPADLVASADAAGVEAEARFAERLGKLDSFKQQHRTSARLHDVRAEWCAALRALRATEQELDREVDSRTDAAWHDDDGAAADRAEDKASLNAKLRELRDMSRMCVMATELPATTAPTATSKRGPRRRLCDGNSARTASAGDVPSRPREAANKEDDESEHRLFQAHGIVARLLVDFRASLATEEEQLAELEASCTAEAGAARRAVAAALAEESEEADHRAPEFDEVFAEARCAVDEEGTLAAAEKDTVAELKAELRLEWAGRREAAEAAEAARRADLRSRFSTHSDGASLLSSEQQQQQQQQQGMVGGARGDWEARAHAIFSEAVALKSCVRGGQQARMARLRVTLPEVREARLAEHLERHDAFSRAAREDRAAADAWARWKVAFGDRARARVRRAIEEARETARLRDEYAALDARRSVLRGEVAALRVDRDAADAERQAVALRRAETDAEHAAAARRLFDQAQARRREAVLAYKATVAATRADDVRRAAAQREAAEGLRPARLRTCAERSSYREVERQKALADQQRDRDRAHLRDLARANALLRLAASVPYAEAIANVVADPLKPTRAFENQRPENRPDYTIAHASEGISDQRLFSDARFKLGVALRAAGVAHSAAAKHAVAALCPRPHRDPILGKE